MIRIDRYIFQAQTLHILELYQIVIHLNQRLKTQHHVQLIYRPLVTWNIVSNT
jgi:hypothetical protein